MTRTADNEEQNKNQLRTLSYFSAGRIRVLKAGRDLMREVEQDKMNRLDLV